MKTVELVAVGNELLTGDTHDTNAHWLSKRLTMLGAFVRQAAFIRDDLNTIRSELRAAQRRKADVIITIGGMGPTPDDMTLEGVARAVGRRLKLSNEALALVKARYEELAAAGHVDDARITAAREKMAHIPKGATPLRNLVGTAPGVLLQLRQTVVICLPGVPVELQGLFNGALQDNLRSLFGSAAFAERNFIVACKDESVLAPIISQLGARHPGVLFKSRPKDYGAEVKSRVRISAVGKDQRDVVEKLDRAVRDFLETLEHAKYNAEEQPEN